MCSTPVQGISYGYHRFLVMQQLALSLLTDHRDDYCNHEWNHHFMIVWLMSIYHAICWKIVTALQ